MASPNQYQFGVIRRVRQGRYVIVESMTLDEELTDYLIFADMLIDQSSYRGYNKLLDVAELFPIA